MDAEFPDIAGLSGAKEHHISRQHECNVIREQWAQVKHETDQTY